MENKKTVLTEERMSRIADLEAQKESLEAQISKLKKECEAEMSEGGQIAYKDNIYSIQWRNGSVSTTLDTAKFEENDKENYDKFFALYNKTSNRKGSFAWTKQKKIEEKEK